MNWPLFEGLFLSRILKVMEESPIYGQITEEWKVLAEALQSSSDNIKTWQTNILLYKQQPRDVLESILIDWKLRLGDQANLNNLMDTIGHRCGWVTVADKLKAANGATKEVSNAKFWRDFPTADQGDLLSKTVFFLGKRRTLFDLGTDVGEYAFRCILEETLNGQQLIEIVQSNDFKLAIDTVPVAPLYYMKRDLVTYTQVDFKIFHEMSSDVFLVDGIDMGTFFSLVKPEGIENSSNQLKQIASRFIILEDPSHYKLICACTSSNVHHLTFHEEKLRWVKTRGDANLVLANLMQIQNVISEVEFVNANLSEHTPTCICILDRPGTGKTELLNSIARRLQSSFTERIVIALGFEDLLEQLKRSNKCVCTSHIKEVISQMVSTNELGRKICFEILSNETNKIELILQGWDNLLIDERPLASDVLSKLLKNNKNIRLFITSKDKVDLEIQHKILYCKIHPLSTDEEMKNYITGSLQAKFGFDKSSEIEKIANDLVEKLGINKPNVESQAAGFPLHSAMLVDAISNIDTVTPIVYFSLYDAVEKYVCKHLPPATNNRTIYYGKLALATIFASESMFDKVYKERRSVLDSEFALTYITSKGERFKHSLYSDFLVSKIFLLALQGKYVRGLEHWTGQNLSISNVLNIVFETKPKCVDGVEFVRPALAYFLDKQMQQTSMHKDTYFLKQIVNHFRNTESVLQVATGAVLHACSICRFNALFCILIDCVVSNTPTSSPLSVYLSQEEMLQLFLNVCKHGNMDLIRKVFEHCVNSSNHKDVVNSTLVKNTQNPLYISAQRGCFKSFQYFWKLYGSTAEQLRGLVHVTVKRTNRLGIGNILERKEILKFLVNTFGKHILQQEDTELCQPIVMPNIHFELIKYLLKCGVNVFVTTPDLCNVAHNAASYLDPSGYHELIEFFLENRIRGIFRARNRSNETPIHTAFKHMTFHEATIKLFVEMGEVDMSSDFGYEDTFLYRLVKERYPPSVLQLALNYSPDWEYLTYFDNSTSLLHVAARCGNVRAVRFFLELGADIDFRDSSGKTALHEACSMLVTKVVPVYDINQVIEELLNSGANTQILDNAGDDALSYFHES